MKNHTVFVLILALCLSCNSQSNTQSGSSSPTMEEADQKMKPYVDEGKLSCISLMVIKDGKTVHKNTFGLGGRVSLKTGEYSWSGMAATFFILDPANDMMTLAFTQYVPNTKCKFAYDYMDMVRAALLEP